MGTWLVQLYYKFMIYRAGLKKHSLPIEDHDSAAFSYSEKGSKVDGIPTIVFIHGLSSNKETWLPIVQNIPDSYHCITVDLPAHGETIGLNEEYYTVDKFVDKLKLFFDTKGLKEPMCIVGASLGGAIVLMFALKYPSYVNRLCLIAPPANEQCETDLIKQMRSGVYKALLPDSLDDFHIMINTLAVTKINLPRLMLNSFFVVRLPLLKEHRKVLTSLLEYDYPNLENYYEQLKDLNKPILILWGRQDRLFTAEGADYFCKLMPHAEKIIFDDCGHLMAIDKAEETARSIIDFFDQHCNNTIKQPVVLEFD